MNCFERRIKFCKILGIAGCILLPIFIVGAVVLGMKLDAEDALIVLPIMLCIASMFSAIFGFAMGFSYRQFYRAAKTLFTEEELRAIDRPMFLQSFIAEKAKRLMEEGKRKNDMTEFNEFCQLAAIARPGFGFYSGRGYY